MSDSGSETEELDRYTPKPDGPVEDVVAAMAFDVSPATAATTETNTETPWWERTAASISLGTGQVKNTETTISLSSKNSTEKDTHTVENSVRELDPHFPETQSIDAASQDQVKSRTTAVSNGKQQSESIDLEIAPQATQEKTIASSSTASDESHEGHKSTKRRSKTDYLGFYFMCIFILVSVAVIVPLAVFTNIFTGDSEPMTSSSESSESGGLPIPTPVPTYSPIFTANTLAPGESVEPCK